MRTLSTALLALAACGGAAAESPAPAARRPAPAPAAAPASATPREARLVGLGKPDGDGGLSAQQILATVKARRPDILECYEVERRQRESLAGKLVASWEIAADGRTQNVELKSTTLNNRSVESCVLGQLAHLVFPPPAGGKLVRVNFPFIFKPGGE